MIINCRCIIITTYVFILLRRRQGHLGGHFPKIKSSIIPNNQRPILSYKNPPKSSGRTPQVSFGDIDGIWAIVFYGRIYNIALWAEKQQHSILGLCL